MTSTTSLSDHEEGYSFSRLPETQRQELLHGLVQNLDSRDRVSIDLAALLASQCHDAKVDETLRRVLLQCIEIGHGDYALSACTKHPDLWPGLLRIVADKLSTHSSGSLLDEDGVDKVPLLFRFCVLALPQISVDEYYSKIFHAALNFLVSGHLRICIHARDVLFRTLTTPNDQIIATVIRPAAGAIWEKITTLCQLTGRGKRVDSIGYALWLRWVSHNVQYVPNNLINNDYWRLLTEGLRLGDTEVRKICLSILRISVARTSFSSDLQEQYSRFCTVFETIILGQYINQIRECEHDLDLLASYNSKLPASWLYALLGAAIDKRVQYANRKFIGNWVMRTNLRPVSELYKFLQVDFLPWALQGQLFVSTLKTKSGALRCLHGDNLTAMIRRLQRAETSVSLGESIASSRTADIVIDLIAHKHDSMFPYATAYLVEGVSERLTSEQRERLHALPLHKMPRVARDCVSATLGSMSMTENLSSTSSRRQILEKEAIAKCADMPPDINSVNELWSDLDYLEQPRDLLMLIPGAIFRGHLLEKAFRDRTFADAIASKFVILQELTTTKTFLLTPLVTAVRKALLTYSETARVLDIQSFIVKLAQRPPESVIDLLLEESMVNFAGFSYEDYLGQPPSIGFAAYLDLCSRLKTNQVLIRGIIDDLMDPWRQQRIPPLTVSAWKSTLQLQVILLCCEQLDQSEKDAKTLFGDLVSMLSIEPLPRYRHLLEWICIRLSTRHNLQITVLDMLANKDHHSNPKLLASLMKVGCILACSDGASETFALDFGTACVPLAASSKVVIRHEAQWQIPVLMDHARQQGWRSVSDNASFAALDDYIRSLQHFEEPPLERVVGKFDPNRDHTFTNLVEGSWWQLDHIESPMTSHDDFAKLYASNSLDGFPSQPSCIPLGEAFPPNMKSHAESSVNQGSEAPEAPKPRTLEQSAALQTKGTAYLARTLSDPDTAPTRPTDVLVVGSLVENPHNLGGLSRASEVFGAAALTLQNQNVLGNRDFTGVSVSSHLHFPIVQLSSRDVPTWLAERRAEGYTVVGIEQTDRSVVLGSDEARLPAKVVLIVGSEREGIPAVVLTECDMLVEIPQRGVTRSLNVQTAAAVVLYEHARQHPRSHGAQTSLG